MGVNPLPELCYLCGEPLAEPVSDDHVPMKQLFAPEVRKKYNPSILLTIPVHDRCNFTSRMKTTLCTRSCRSPPAHIPERRSTKRCYGTIEAARTSGSSVKYWASSNLDQAAWCFPEIKW